MSKDSGVYLNQRFRVMPYNIHGVKLYAVEGANGDIKCYCDSKDDAQETCNELNKESK